MKIKAVLERGVDNIMGLLESIKRSALKSGTVLPTDEDSDKILALLNKMFYLEKKPSEEAEFIRHVITRGTGELERSGLHASSLIVDEKDYCLRKQVLSLIFKQNIADEDNVPIKLKRVFEEGNSVHEKWQRMFIRAGYAKVNDIDTTQFNAKYRISFSPDIICDIEPYGKMIVEIKSVNTRQFTAMARHPSAWKQLQLYMFLTGIHKGFVLNEDKNSQELSVEYYTFSRKSISEQIKRMQEIKKAYKEMMRNKVMTPRPESCCSVNCELCQKCYMSNACWNIGIGRKRLK